MVPGAKDGGLTIGAFEHAAVGMAVDCEREGNGANDGIEEDIIKLYIIRMTSACHFGQFMYQDCVNIPGGMGLFRPCLRWNRACIRSRWSLFRVWQVLSSRTEE